MIREFVKVGEQTKHHRYTTFTHIFIYMDISKELSKAIILNWEDEEWVQPIDYEQVPFRCKKFHDYGHFTRNFPNMNQQSSLNDPPQGGEGGER